LPPERRLAAALRRMPSTAKMQRANTARNAAVTHFFVTGEKKPAQRCAFITASSQIFCEFCVVFQRAHEMPRCARFISSPSPPRRPAGWCAEQNEEGEPRMNTFFRDEHTIECYAHREPQNIRRTIFHLFTACRERPPLMVCVVRGSDMCARKRAPLRQQRMPSYRMSARVAPEC